MISSLLPSSSIYFITVTHSNNLHLLLKVNGKKPAKNFLKYERILLKHPTKLRAFYKHINQSKLQNVSPYHHGYLGLNILHGNEANM